MEVQQGIRVLGAPLGHPAFIADQSENLAVEHQTLLDRIPSLKICSVVGLAVALCVSTCNCSSEW